eukprot:COSAG06_NODE_9666_length_1847_cov_32.537757_2_plen_88_part_00
MICQDRLGTKKRTEKTQNKRNLFFFFRRAETIQDLQSDLFEAQAAIEQAQKDAQAQIQEVRRTAEAALFGLEVRGEEKTAGFLVFWC